MRQPTTKPNALSPRAWPVVALALAALIASCSSPPSATGPGGSAGGGVFGDGLSFGGQDGIGGNGSAGKADGAGAGDGSGGGDGASGVADGAGANPGNGCEFEPAPLAGEPGAPCKGNGDCDSGICVDGLDGRICSRTCADCCPSGFACEQWNKSDVQYICVPKLAALCRPCIADADCEAVNAGALCLSYGADGAFCGGACDAAADCPVGYACEQKTGSAGTSKQCVRKQGQCTCSPAATAAGAKTICTTTNDAGACPGTRTCGADGLGPCDAPAAVAEVCNGQDDNCDGATDEGVGGGEPCKISNAFGSCTGATICSEGGVLCDGQTPEAEVCNGKDDNCDGVTDEGSLDIDQDGVADCVDPDVDGDKIANADDCAPNDASVYPGAPELCDGKDNNCNNELDEPGATGCKTYYADVDQDGFGDGAKSACLCAPNGTYSAEQAGDCNDLIGAIAPGGVELCDNGDNDCDGQTDEGFDKGKPCENGVGTCKEFGTMVCANDGKSVVCSAGGGTGGAEVCNGKDDDCNGQTDEGFGVGTPCVSGKGACAKSGNTVCAPGGGTTCDAVPGVGTGEKCDGIDNDCNGLTDEGCDDDLDGWCDKNMPFVNSLACPKGQGDCDDGYSGAYPGAPEVCNGKDDDCDGKIDGIIEDCSNGCGKGTRACSAGSWGACSAPTPKCTSGPCCDGCNFKSSATKCGSSPTKTEYKCSGACGGDAYKYETWQYCTGSSASCGSGNLKTSNAGMAKNCSAGQLCQASGGSYSCKTCSGGCNGSTCNQQPTYTICIDPQFGGNSAGACHFGVCTKTLNLDIAQKLKALLDKDTSNSSGGGNWKVVMTRTGDTDPSTSARVATCNNAGSHRVLSVAVNAYTSSAVKGIESYYYKGSSQSYCGLVHNEVVARTGLYNRGLKTSSYSIIKNVSTPYACFPAPGFLSNSGDAAKLKDANFRNEIARGILHGIQKSFGYGAFNP